eukprot:3284094-Amphidinium_carterae.1
MLTLHACGGSVGDDIVESVLKGLRCTTTVTGAALLCVGIAVVVAVAALGAARLYLEYLRMSCAVAGHSAGSVQDGSCGAE